MDRQLYVILTAVSHKGPHDSIGILVPAALISAIGIASLRRRRYAAVAVVSCFALLQVAVMTLPSTLGARVGTFGWVDVVSPFPLAEDWKVEDTLHSLANRPARVAVVSDHIFINGTTLRFYALKDNLPLDVSPCWRSGVDSVALRRYDVVIAKSDDVWVHPSYDGCFKGPAGREEVRRLTPSPRRSIGGVHFDPVSRIARRFVDAGVHCTDSGTRCVVTKQTDERHR